ncbi:penicillin-binding protein [bacterium]|nr:penicillin-binding protein [bacterium]
MDFYSSHDRENKKKTILVFGSALTGLVFLGIVVAWAIVDKQIKFPFRVTSEYLAPIVTRHLDLTGEVPTTLEIPKYRNLQENIHVSVGNTLVEGYKEIIQKYLKRYKPDYGAFAVMNADTGELLAIESFVKDEENFNMGNLAIRSPFPAASISKIITAAAAIDEGKAYAETIIPYNGKRSTLYKRNVNSEKVNKWTRHVTLRQAFAQSINTVFGKLGAFHLGGTDLLKYAENFMFNKNVETDLLIEKSRFILDPSNRWDIVESAAGFTHRTMMSPVHGAMIASAILNEGEMKIPYVIRDIRDEDGIYVYQGRPKEPHTVLVPYSARQMKLLMEETVLHGTSRKYFKGFARQFDEVEFGGKTGSLDGKNVKGRTDWFVGYAAHDDLRLSIGVVTVHDKYWTVKSSYLARVFFEDVFRQQSKLTRELEKKKAQKHAKANP